MYASVMSRLTLGETIACRGMAEAVGANLGVPIEGISHQEALQKQMLSPLIIAVIALNNWRPRADSAKARRQLHWKGTNVDMLKEVASGSYTGNIVSKSYDLD